MWIICRCLYCSRLHMKSNHWHDSDNNQVKPCLFQFEKEGCGMHFMWRRGLASHLMHINDRSTNFCGLCMTQLKGKEALLVHLQTKHGVREWGSLQHICNVQGCNVRCRTQNEIIQQKGTEHKIDGRNEDIKR